MKLCVTCSTYNRPHLLPRIIACFEAQDYEDRYMVIFDDGGQYDQLGGDRWKLISTPDRCSSLGQKRNAVLDMVPEDTYAVLPCDDDDLFLPWHLSAAAAALSVADWSRPSVVLSPRIIGNMWLFIANYTGHKHDQTYERMYHPAWAMRLSTIRELGGYPPELSGPEDKGLMLKMEKAGVSQADPIEFGFPPSYVYCWGESNISGMLHGKADTGSDAWARLQTEVQHADLFQWTPPFDLQNPVVAPHIQSRPF